MATRSMGSLKLQVKITGTVTNTLDDGTIASSAQPNLTYAPTLADGVSADQANRGWHVLSRSLGNNDQDILDLYSTWDLGAGTGLDGVGQQLVLEEIVAIAIVNNNDVDADGQLEIYPSASEGWAPIGSHTQANGGALRGQGMLLKSQPAEAAFDVGDVTHRITFHAYGGDVEYSIYILGRHDDNESSSSSLSSSSSSSVSSSSSSTSSISSQSTSSISTSGSSSSISTSASSVSSSSSSSLSSSSRSVSSVSSSSSSEQSSSMSSSP